MAYSGPAEPLKPVLFPVKLGNDESVYYLSETELCLLREDPHLVLIEGEIYPESVKPRVGPPLKPGYRVIPSFPDYCVNRKANVRHIQTGRSCWLEDGSFSFYAEAVHADDKPEVSLIFDNSQDGYKTYQQLQKELNREPTFDEMIKG